MTTYRGICAIPATVAIIVVLALASANTYTDAARLTISAVSQPSSPCAPAPHCAPPQSKQAFIDLFGYIESIPDTVLRQGDDATNQWVRDHPRKKPGARRADYTYPAPEKADALGCTVAVGAILVSVAVPAARLIKLKEYIKALGGIFEAAKLLVVVGSTADRTEAVVIALGALVGELSGIKGVRDNCFN